MQFYLFFWHCYLGLLIIHRAKKQFLTFAVATLRICPVVSARASARFSVCLRVCACLRSAHLFLLTNDSAAPNKHSGPFRLANKGLMTSQITMERRGEYSRAPPPNYQSVKQWLHRPLSSLASLVVAQVNKSNTLVCTYAHVHHGKTSH